MPENALMIDTTVFPEKLSQKDALLLEEKFYDYFRNAPAYFRKIFKDNPSEFYHAYKQGEYDQLLRTGALTEKQIELKNEAIAAARSDERNAIYTDVRRTLEQEYKTKYEQMVKTANMQQNQAGNTSSQIPNTNGGTI